MVINILKSATFWLSRFLAYSLFILALGTGAFVIGFLILGLSFSSLGPRELVEYGAWVGFRYVGMWTMGIATVWCIIKAKKLRERRSS